MHIAGVPEGPCEVFARLGSLYAQNARADVRRGVEAIVEIPYLGLRPETLLSVRFVGRFAQPLIEHVTLEGLGIERRAAESAYSFSRLPAGPFTLRVEDPRYEPLRRDGLMPGPETIELGLRANSALRFRVVADETGAPIERFGVRGAFLEEFAPDPAYGRTWRELASEVDREGGLLLLDDVVAGDHEFRLTSPGHPWTRFDVQGLQSGETREVEVRLQAVTRCEGRVVCGERSDPVGGAHVHLYTEAGVEVAFKGAQDDGTFVFERVRPGLYRFVATTGGCRTEVLREVRTGVPWESLELRLPHSARIEVTLKGPNGATRKDSRVLIERRDEKDSLAFLTSSGPTVENSITFGPFAPGRHRVSWSFGPESHPWIPRGDVDLVDGETKRVELDLADVWPGRLEVDVTDPRGPVLGIEVIARHTSQERGGFSTVADAAGRAVFPDVFSGELELLVRDEKRRFSYAHPERTFVSPSSTTRAAVRIPFGKSTVRFVEEDSGAPFAYCYLALWRSGQENAFADPILTAADGSFDLGYVSPGATYDAFDYWEAVRSATDAQTGRVDWVRWRKSITDPPHFAIGADGPEPAVVRVPKLVR